MFSFFFNKKTPQHLDFSCLGVDMHSHLIPGIDDGAKTLDDTVEMVRHLQSLGYQKIYTTPHIYNDYYPNEASTIQKGLAEVRERLHTEGVAIEIGAAAEYFMDEHYASLLDQGALLTLPNNHVLLEMSFYGAPPLLDTYIFRTQTKGYKPIIAHPERYLFYENNFKGYEKLKAAGCLFQMNILSLVGYYNPQVQRNAQKLLKAGMIDLLGTDMHHMRHGKALAHSLTQKDLIKILDKHSFLNVSLFL